MPVLTRRLALVALALAALRYLLPDDLPGGLLLLDGALVVAVILDFALGTAPGRVEVDRRAPSVVVVGQRAPLRWTVRNPGDRPLLVSVADDLASSLHAEQRRFSVEVPARGAATVETELVPSRRGRFEPSQLVVRTRGPLGLMERQRTRRQHATIRVHPPFRSKGEAELLVNRARVLEVGLRSARGRGGGTDFDQLRDYGPDDEFRRIDWAATARAGHPIVRTYRAERNQTVLTLLDAGRLMAARVEGVPRLEHAMDATMVLATVATRVGDRFGLVTFSEEVRTVLEPSKQRAHAGKVTEALYDLEPE